MPRIEAAPPVKESPTIYDAFNESKKSGKEQVKPSTDASAAAAAAQGGSKKTQQHKKKQGKGDKKKEKPLSLEEALAQIECCDLETVLLKDQTIFPNHPSVWLKDVASILNVRLDRVPENDPVFSDKPKDYPSSQLPKDVHKLLEKTLSQCSDTTLKIFYDHCIQSMINDIGKGISTYGYRIFIQLLAFQKPEIIMSALQQSLEHLKNHQNRALRCLSIMWAVGQVGINDLGRGLKVWLDVMLPVLNIRALSTYAVEYLDGLFRAHTDLKSAYGTLEFRSFFPIMDMMFSTNPGLPTNLQKKLHGIYPKLKTISYGDDPASDLRNFFPSFLVRLTANCGQKLKTELLSSLVDCLATDKHCYSVWRQMYTKNITPSSMLLKHILDNWETIQKSLDRKILRETIRAFSITNEELSTQGKAGGQDYNQCVATCKELLEKMNKMRFPWRFLIFLILTTFAGIIAYDIYISTGFKKSRTAKFLQDTGLLVFFEQVVARIQLYGGKAIQWLQENVPYYYGKACEFAGPYLTLFWEKLYAFGVFVAEVTKPQRDWLHQKVPEFLEWVQSKVPWLWSGCSYYLGLLWEYTVYISLWLWTHLVHTTHTVGTWLQENVFTGSWSVENIQRALSSSVAAMQDYSTSFVLWCKETWAGKTN